jgi:hypothetical protein
MPSFRHRRAHDDESQSSKPKQRSRTRTRSVDPSVALASVPGLDSGLEAHREHAAKTTEVPQMDAIVELSDDESPIGQGFDLVNGEAACAMNDASSSASSSASDGGATKKDQRGSSSNHNASGTMAEIDASI